MILNCLIIMLYKPSDRKDWIYIIASHSAVEIRFSFPNIAITRRAMYDGNYTLVFYLSYYNTNSLPLVDLLYIIASFRVAWKSGRSPSEFEWVIKLNVKSWYFILFQTRLETSQSLVSHVSEFFRLRILFWCRSASKHLWFF